MLAGLAADDGGKPLQAGDLTAAFTGDEAQRLIDNGFARKATPADLKPQPLKAAGRSIERAVKSVVREVRKAAR